MTNGPLLFLAPRPKLVRGYENRARWRFCISHEKNRSKKCSPKYALIGKRSDITRGQATIEYVLLLSMAALIGLTFMSSFRQMLGEGILHFNVILEREVMTGSYDKAATQWEN